MRITIMTGDGSVGISDIQGEENVSHALEVFSNAMVAAGFARYEFEIAGREDDTGPD